MSFVKNFICYCCYWLGICFRKLFFDFEYPFIFSPFLLFPFLLMSFNFVKWKFGIFCISKRRWWTQTHTHIHFNLRTWQWWIVLFFSFNQLYRIYIFGVLVDGAMAVFSPFYFERRWGGRGSGRWWQMQMVALTALLMRNPMLFLLSDRLIDGLTILPMFVSLSIS